MTRTNLSKELLGRSTETPRYRLADASSVGTGLWDTTFLTSHKGHVFPWSHRQTGI